MKNAWLVGRRATRSEIAEQARKWRASLTVQSRSHGSGDGRNWADASPRKRCPVCGEDSWCQISRTNETVLCKRVSAGASNTKTSRDGTVFYVHGVETSKPFELPEALAPSTERATAEVRHAAYTAVLDALALSPEHRAGLRARGLSDENIHTAGYRSLEVRGRKALADAIVQRVGEAQALGVPGFYRAEKDGRSWYSLAGYPGTLVPCRDLEGRIVSLKVRRDGAIEGPRYGYISSRSKGGASAESAVHVPCIKPTKSGIVISEGELKSDCITALSGVRTVSAPGVGAWRLVLPVLQALGAHDVTSAFDMDALENPVVARASRELTEALQALGYRFRVARWDPRWKGLDDYLNRACTEVQR